MRKNKGKEVLERVDMCIGNTRHMDIIADAGAVASEKQVSASRALVPWGGYVGNLALLERPQHR